MGIYRFPFPTVPFPVIMKERHEALLTDDLLTQRRCILEGDPED